MRDRKSGTIIFENVTQAAIFECELKGQISDGHWENYRHSNYPFWCDLDVRWRQRGEDVGCRPAPARALRFDDPALYEIVGDRMIHYARLAMTAVALDIEPLRFARTMEYVLWDRKGRPYWHGIPQWWIDSAKNQKSPAHECYYTRMIQYATSFDKLRVLREASRVWNTYNKQELIKDLKRIRAIAKLPLMQEVA